jgi:hypothetical protein
MFLTLLLVVFIAWCICIAGWSIYAVTAPVAKKADYIASAVSAKVCNVSSVSVEATKEERKNDIWHKYWECRVAYFNTDLPSSGPLKCEVSKHCNERWR